MRRSLVVTVCALLAGCLSLTSPPARFYTLSAVDPPAPASRPLVIALSEITLPDYLDRPEIVSRAGATEMRVADQSRWAEPLAPMFRRVLGEELKAKTGASEIQRLPLRRDLPYNALIDTEIVRFDADEAGRVVLDARWRVFAGDGERLLASRETSAREQGAPAPDYPAMVEAMNRAVATLAADIAAALPRPGTTRQRR